MLYTLPLLQLIEEANIVYSDEGHSGGPYYLWSAFFLFIHRIVCRWFGPILIECELQYKKILVDAIVIWVLSILNAGLRALWIAMQIL